MDGSISSKSSEFSVKTLKKSKMSKKLKKKKVKSKKGKFRKIIISPSDKLTKKQKQSSKSLCYMDKSDDTEISDDYDFKDEMFSNRTITFKKSGNLNMKKETFDQILVKKTCHAKLCCNSEINKTYIINSRKRINKIESPENSKVCCARISGPNVLEKCSKDTYVYKETKSGSAKLCKHKSNAKPCECQQNRSKTRSRSESLDQNSISHKRSRVSPSQSRERKESCESQINRSHEQKMSMSYKYTKCPSHERRRSRSNERKKIQSNERRRSRSIELQKSITNERRRSRSFERQNRITNERRSSMSFERQKSSKNECRRSKSIEQQKRITNECRSSSSFERKKNITNERLRSRSFERQKNRSFERHRSRSFEQHRSISNERQRSRSFERHRSRSFEQHRSRSIEQQKSISTERPNSRSFGRQRSRSFERHRSISNERHRSISNERQRSRSFERHRSRSFEQHRSRSFERQRSRSFERQKSISTESPNSRSFERQKSITNERRRSKSFDRQRSKSVERQKSITNERRRSRSFERQKNRSFERQRSRSIERHRSTSRESIKGVSLEYNKYESTEHSRSISPIEQNRSRKRIPDHYKSKYRYMLKTCEDDIEKDKIKYLLVPHSHPNYTEEWINFVKLRSASIKTLDGDPYNYDFINEWKTTAWEQKLKVLISKEFQKKEEYCRKWVFDQVEMEEVKNLSKFKLSPLLSKSNEKYTTHKSLDVSKNKVKLKNYKYNDNNDISQSNNICQSFSPYDSNTDTNLLKKDNVDIDTDIGKLTKVFKTNEKNTDFDYSITHSPQSVQNQSTKDNQMPEIKLKNQVINDTYSMVKQIKNYIKDYKSNQQPGKEVENKQNNDCLSKNKMQINVKGLKFKSDVLNNVGSIDKISNESFTYTEAKHFPDISSETFDLSSDGYNTLNNCTNTGVKYSSNSGTLNNCTNAGVKYSSNSGNITINNSMDNKLNKKTDLNVTINDSNSDIEMINMNSPIKQKSNLSQNVLIDPLIDSSENNKQLDVNSAIQTNNKPYRSSTLNKSNLNLKNNKLTEELDIKEICNKITSETLSESLMSHNDPTTLSESLMSHNDPTNCVPLKAGTNIVAKIDENNIVCVNNENVTIKDADKDARIVLATSLCELVSDIFQLNLCEDNLKENVDSILESIRKNEDPLIIFKDKTTKLILELIKTSLKINLAKDELNLIRRCLGQEFLDKLIGLIDEIEQNCIASETLATIGFTSHVSSISSPVCTSSIPQILITQSHCSISSVPNEPSLVKSSKYIPIIPSTISQEIHSSMLDVSPSTTQKVTSLYIPIRTSTSNITTVDLHKLNNINLPSSSHTTNEITSQSVNTDVNLSLQSDYISVNPMSKCNMAVTNNNSPVVSCSNVTTTPSSVIFCPSVTATPSSVISCPSVISPHSSHATMNQFHSRQFVSTDVSRPTNSGVASMQHGTSSVLPITDTITSRTNFPIQEKVSILSEKTSTNPDTLYGMDIKHLASIVEDDSSKEDIFGLIQNCLVYDGHTNVTQDVIHTIYLAVITAQEEL